MKNLQALANELAASKMTLLVANDMLNIKGGTGCGGGSKKSKKSHKSRKSRKSRKSSKGGGYGCGCGYGYLTT